MVYFHLPAANEMELEIITTVQVSRSKLYFFGSTIIPYRVYRFISFLRPIADFLWSFFLTRHMSFLCVCTQHGPRTGSNQFSTARQQAITAAFRVLYLFFDDKMTPCFITFLGMEASLIQCVHSLLESNDSRAV
jgi:hypothetical protein